MANQRWITAKLFDIFIPVIFNAAVALKSKHHVRDPLYAFSSENGDVIMSLIYFGGREIDRRRGLSMLFPKMQIESHLYLAMFWVTAFCNERMAITCFSLFYMGGYLSARRKCAAEARWENFRGGWKPALRLKGPGNDVSAGNHYYTTEAPTSCRQTST